MESIVDLLKLFGQRSRSTFALSLQLLADEVQAVLFAYHFELCEISQGIHYLHVKYKRPICNAFQVMGKVKIFVHVANTDADADTIMSATRPKRTKIGDF